MIIFTPVPEITPAKGEEDDEPTTFRISLFYLCLLLNPFLMATGQVMTRAMRKLNENVVACYMNATAIPVFIGLCYATGGDLTAWRDFECLQWICIFAISLSVIAS